MVACLPWAMTSERDARSSGVEVGFAVVDALREKEQNHRRVSDLCGSDWYGRALASGVVGGSGGGDYG